MNAVLKSQYEQYRNYLNSIEMINIKYHDLKHQLAGLRAEIDPEKRTEWIDRMSREVQAYKPEQETGNPGPQHHDRRQDPDNEEPAHSVHLRRGRAAPWFYARN